MIFSPLRFCSFQASSPLRRAKSFEQTCALLLALCFALLAPVLTMSQTRGVARRARAARNAGAAVDLIISGGTVVTMNEARDVIEDGAIAIRGNRIIAVGTSAQITRNYTPRESINARGQVVIPGLVNGHTHIPMTLFRGLADDLDLNDWLTNYIFPAEAANVTEEFVRVGTRLGLAEMIRAGTTTFCDMYYFEDAIADETARAGVRAVLGETVIGFPVPDNKTPGDALRYTEKFIAKWRGHPLITPAVAPHAPYTVSEANLRAAHALSARTNTPLLIHIAETEKEVADVMQKTGARPVAYLARIGVLDNRTIAAHLVFPDEAEIATLNRLGVGVVHNPQSNMKLASGIAPVPAMRRQGVAVGLGTDGAASNNDLDLWEEMDTAAKLHKVATRNPTVLSAREAFAMGTIEGARALHLEQQIGSLEAGKLADIAIVGFDALHQTPAYDVYSHLVYATKASDVRSVVINGRIVMRDRRLLTLDEARIKADARRFAARIRQNLAPRPQASGAPKP